MAEVEVKKQEVKQAQLCCLLRFAGSLHLISKSIVLEAEVDSEPVMNQLVELLQTLHRVSPDVFKVAGGNLHKEDRYVIRVVQGAKEVAQLTGLVDRLGRPVRGLPAKLIAGTKLEAIAAWRGAFMARGSLSKPGRSSSLEITCPGAEAALALVGAARRLGIVAKPREVRGSGRVVIKDGEMITVLLELMGAKATLATWKQQRSRREIRGSVNRLANFDDANLRRSVNAAVAAGVRVRRAFEILGEDVPEHLASAGRLRLAYRDASLEELGQKADPPLTKDAVAGRIRRLLALADKTAKDQGIPDTQAALPPEMNDGYV